MKKYRPYFSLPELKHLHSLSLADNQLSSITRYLGKYILDVDSGYRVASINIAPSLEDKLGFTESAARGDKTIFMKEQERRYLANEMNAMEEQIYESSLGLSFLSNEEPT